MLETRVYDAAIDLLNSVIKSHPSEANAYYYLALALVKGRNPKELTYREAEKICNYLQTACTLSKHQYSHYYYLWASVKQDFYHSNGFRIDPPDVDELMALAKKAKFDRDKIAQLLRHLSPRHSLVLDAVRNRR